MRNVIYAAVRPYERAVFLMHARAPFLRSFRAIWLAATALSCGSAITACASLIGADFDGLHPPTSEVPDAALGDASSDARADAPRDAPVDTEVGLKPADGALDGKNPGDAGPLLGKTVFVTSSLFAANLGGIAGADTKCQQSATAAGLTGVYRAWLSDEVTHAQASLTHATVPYVLVDGTLVAPSWTQLVSGSLSHAIDRTELGGAPPATTGCGAANGVWTGTDAAGAGTLGQTCASWTSIVATSSAVVGDTTLSSNRWSNNSTCACSNIAPLYCFEQ